MSENETKLKPCPFCGSTTMRELHTVHKVNGSVMYYGRCACGCKTHPYSTIESAVAGWNAKKHRRAGE